MTAATTSRDAAAAWHAQLDVSPDLAEASWTALEAGLRRADLHFGHRALCTVLRPRLMTPAEYHRLSDQMAAVMRAFGTAYARAIADPAARAQFRLTDWEESLIADDRSAVPPSPHSRMDTFVLPDNGALQITEYNGETPAGPFFNDALTEAFATLPITRAFSADWRLTPIPSRHGVVRVLLDAWEAFSGSRRRPHLAILDWDGVSTAVEFQLAQQVFAAQGLTCDIGDPRECTYDGGVLRLRGTPVDLVYKRVLIDELVLREGLDSPVVRAVRDRAVCFLNGFRSKILHKKASLAVLSDERNADWFDATATAAIRAQIPWTRVVEPRQTVNASGEAIDLLPWAAANRAHLVLKPNDAYGGAGIVLGWTVTDAEWQSALAHAVTEPFIVQERVPIPKDAYPSWDAGRVVFADRQVDTAPFLCHSAAVEGVLTRLSTAELLNVTAGGGSQTPTVLVERR
ncbi:MAG: hypothetical protein SFW08_04535 [Gemmatimonadaceae bacterium]|nr:hypothetical protein [Gemmatimonadaceae bacterium]